MDSHPYSVARFSMVSTKQQQLKLLNTFRKTWLAISETNARLEQTRRLLDQARARFQFPIRRPAKPSVGT